MVRSGNRRRTPLHGCTKEGTTLVRETTLYQPATPKESDPGSRSLLHQAAESLTTDRRTKTGPYHASPRRQSHFPSLTLLIGSLFAIAFAAHLPLKALSCLAAAEIPALLTTLLLVRIARNADAAQPSPSRVNPTGQ